LNLKPAHTAHHEEKTMSRKLTIALIAAASLSAIALVPSTAAAKGGGFGGHGFHHGHFGGFGGVGFDAGDTDDDGCYAVRRVYTPYGYRLRTVNVCAY
jgi:hypothetical protein